MHIVHLTFIIYSKYTDGVTSIEGQLQLIEEKVNLSVNLATLLSALEENMEEYFKSVYVIEINKLFMRSTGELYFKVADLLTETSGGWSYLHTHLNSAFGFRHVYKKFAKNHEGLTLIPATSTKKPSPLNIDTSTETVAETKSTETEINGTGVLPKVRKPRTNKEKVSAPKITKTKENLNKDSKKPKEPKTITKRGPRGPYKKKDK